MSILARTARRAILAAACAAAAAPAFAQSSAACDPSRARVELPLFDAPYNVEHGYRAPGMPMALGISETFYEASHRAIQRAWGDREVAGRLSVIGWDLLTSAVLPLPGGDVWLHEEFHRAVMGRRGMDSFNDVYKFRIWEDTIAVSRVLDDDLVRLKRDHPAEQVRLGAAGIEGEQQLVRRLERQQFFNCSPAWHLPLYLFAKLGSIGYVMSGTWDEINADTDEMNAKDGRDVRVRDFTGHDLVGWVYDLHRPDEPYAARGLHPSGVGIDRYRKPSHLTPEELRYLERMGRLQWLNLVDPFMVGIRGFTVTSPFDGRPMRVNASLSHILTSFGHAVDANLFVRQDELKVLLVIHAYANGERRFPGLELALVDLPIDIGRRSFDVSLRGALWLQPDEQRFRTSDATPGALASLKVHAPRSGRVGAFVEVEGKTTGWVAGIPYLGPNVSVRIGASVPLR
jgi:hypothetical protein